MESPEMMQRTDEWFRAKIGKVGASRINDVMAKLKGNGEAAARRNYRMELVVARLTGEYPESYCSPVMQRGIELEPAARTAYSFISGNEVATCGFLNHPEIDMCGASPDGLIEPDGLLEIKCPVTANHIEWMLAGKVPTEHVNQILWQLEVTGRKWADFVSYDPRCPVELQLFTVRMERDEDKIAEIKAAVIQFLAEVDDYEQRLRERMQAA